MRVLQFALLWTLLFLPLRSQANSVDQELLASIRQVALNYLDADLRRDTDKMDTLLDSTFRLTWYTRAGFHVSDKTQMLENMRKLPQMSARIMAPEAVVLSVVGNIAIVKAVTKDRVNILSILMVGAYRKILSSVTQPREAEFR